MSSSDGKSVIKKLFIIEGCGKGLGLGRHNGMVIFVPYAAPGDEVDVKLIKNRKSYWEAKLLNICNPSPFRIQPKCKHFGICGGCQWQHVQYQQQLVIKQKFVQDSIERIANIKEPLPYHHILEAPREFYYRNKLEFAYSDRRWLTPEQIRSNIVFEQRSLGFHLPKLFDKVLNIDYCYLQAEPSNQIRFFAYEFAFKKNVPFINVKTKAGLARNLIIKNNLRGEFMVIWVLKKYDESLCRNFTTELVKRFPQIVSIYVAINDKLNDSTENVQLYHMFGQKHIIHKLGKYEYYVGPLSFFQVNTEQAEKLYQTAVELVQPNGKEVVFDFYSGTGSIGIYFSSFVRKVFGFEMVSDAVRDGWLNIKNNNICNMELIEADLTRDSLKTLKKELPYPDIVILDPPRAGLHPRVISLLMDLKPQKIISISCNPATQARDLNQMKGMYSIEAIQPIDMFPQTNHVENIVLLKKNTNINFVFI